MWLVFIPIFFLFGPKHSLMNIFGDSLECLHVPEKLCVQEQVPCYCLSEVLLPNKIFSSVFLNLSLSEECWGEFMVIGSHEGAWSGRTLRERAFPPQTVLMGSWSESPQRQQHNYRKPWYHQKGGGVFTSHLLLFERLIKIMLQRDMWPLSSIFQMTAPTPRSFSDGHDDHQHCYPKVPLVYWD